MARNQRNQEHDIRLKMVFIGDAATGKSALVVRIQEDRFIGGFHPVTNGVEFGSQTVKADGKVVKVQMWDCAGAGKFFQVTKNYFKGSDGVVVVFDMSRRETFDRTREWMADIGTIATSDVDGAVVPILLLACKSDLRDERQVSTEEIEQLGQQFSCFSTGECSSKTGENVHEIFTTFTAHIVRENRYHDSDRAKLPRGRDYGPDHVVPKRPTHQSLMGAIDARAGASELAAFCTPETVNERLLFRDKLHYPLHFAIACRSVDAVNVLIRKGALVDRVDSEGHTALHLAVKQQHQEIARILIRRGAPVNATDQTGSTPLHYACREDDEGTVKILLDAHADKRILNRNEESPLTIARSKRRVRAMLETPQELLHYACETGNVAEIDRLCSTNAAKINTRIQGNIALHSAVFGRHLDAVQACLRHGAAVNEANEEGQVALHIAVQQKSEPIVELLLTMGADPCLTDQRRKSAIDYAVITSPNLLQTLLDCVVADRGEEMANEMKLNAHLEAVSTNRVAAAELLTAYKPAASVLLLRRKGVPVTARNDQVANTTIKTLRTRVNLLEERMEENAGMHASYIKMYKENFEKIRESLETQVIVDHERIWMLSADVDGMLWRAQTDSDNTREPPDVALRETIFSLETAAAAKDAELSVLRQLLATTQQDAVSARASLLLAERATVAATSERDQSLHLQREIQTENSERTKTLNELKTSREHGIDAAELEIDSRQLGNGSNGAVFAARWLGSPVAIKRLFALSTSNPSYADIPREQRQFVSRQVEREIEALQRLRNPYLVLFYGYTMSVDGLVDCIVTELLKPVTLDGAHLVAAHFSLCVARALTYLQLRNIIHRDVKLSNVLYDQGRNVYKLADLGEAKIVGRLTARQTDGKHGTPDFMSPEIRNITEESASSITPAADVFSFAVLVTEVYTGRLASPGPATQPVPDTAYLAMVAETVRRASDLSHLAEGDVKAMVIRSLATAPAERPTARQWADMLQASGADATLGVIP